MHPLGIQNHYVERLHKLYFYNAPTLFVTTWKLLAPFVDPVTRAKVECVAPSQAQDCFSRSFNMDQLPGFVEGGTGPTMLITDLNLCRSNSLGDVELLTAKAQQLQGLQAG
ncbi:CRAL-TRIO domain-containing protein [Haematococcus lacustris]|uniref:CRAL-TRIO domain-containing protein n=1 Tax=Haematococcus lacustris TaxID=44745 RepID=A0A699ZWA1_HAELA|nr:CRAL-TRIO domain-containing protein [Haematococcus lacustris]